MDLPYYLWEECSHEVLDLADLIPKKDFKDSLRLAWNTKEWHFIFPELFLRKWDEDLKNICEGISIILQNQSFSNYVT